MYLLVKTRQVQRTHLRLFIWHFLQNSIVSKGDVGGLSKRWLETWRGNPETPLKPAECRWPGKSPCCGGTRKKHFTANQSLAQGSCPVLSQIYLRACVAISGHVSQGRGRGFSWQEDKNIFHSKMSIRGTSMCVFLSFRLKGPAEWALSMSSADDHVLSIDHTVMVKPLCLNHCLENGASYLYNS